MARQKKIPTKRQIANWKGAGADYVGDWISWGGDPDEFCGQSEAYDMAECSDPDNREVAADYIYEGMRDAIKKVLAKKEAS